MLFLDTQYLKPGPLLAGALRRAADMIEKEGWWAIHHHCTAPGYCPVTALLVLGYTLPVSISRELSRFNDEPGRTEEEVLTHIREMASQMEVGETNYET